MKKTIQIYHNNELIKTRNTAREYKFAVLVRWDPTGKWLLESCSTTKEGAEAAVKAADKYYHHKVEFAITTDIR